jgi:hypothetical protein
LSTIRAPDSITVQAHLPMRNDGNEPEEPASWGTVGRTKPLMPVMPLLLPSADADIPSLYAYCDTAWSNTFL